MDAKIDNIEIDAENDVSADIIIEEGLPNSDVQINLLIGGVMHTRIRIGSAISPNGPIPVIQLWGEDWHKNEPDAYFPLTDDAVRQLKMLQEPKWNTLP